jgi:hypothetical protein
MNISPRTKTLIDLLPKGHRLTPSMRDAIIAASAAGEQFGGRKIALQSDARMSALGRQQALNLSLTTNHGPALVRAGASVRKARAEHKARYAALKVKPIDTTNSVAELRRMEMRTYLCSLDLMERQSFALTTESQLVLESILTAEVPGLAGFGTQLAQFLPQVEQRYREVVYPNELAELAALDDVIKPAEQAYHIARNEMRSTVDMHPHDFDELMKPVETIKPWLVDDDKQVCEIGSDGKPSYRKATETDRANGVRYDNFEAYQAAQGIAA